MLPVRFLRSRLLPPLLVLAALAPAPAEAQFGKNAKIQYRDFKWQVYHSTHFDIHYYPEEEGMLEKVASFAESAYDHLSRQFDFQIKEPTNLIFYATHSAFEQTHVIDTFIPEGTGAFATPIRSRMVLPVDIPDGELMELLLHELTHIFEYHMLFGGSVTKGVGQVPPLWFMEGLASYMAKDESARDRMYLRDAVVNDNLPSVDQPIRGFFAYRFGHAVFDFMEDRWGQEGLRDFLIETRNTLGGRAGRSIERTFQMSTEDFDSEFRRWLRRRYLPELVATGEPSDFGRPFKIKNAESWQTSPAASPSGDLVAAFSTAEGDVDVILFDATNRTQIKNLTKGFNTEFQYYVAQEMSLGRKQGRDLSFSPDGNSVAFFARKNRGRSLVLLNVLKGKIQREISMDVEQQLSPAWHPDGRRVAFAGFRDGQFDIFTIDIQTGEVVNLTNDEVYDGAPTFSPDGRTLAFSSAIGGGSKIFTLSLDNPSQRVQVTFGEGEDTDPVFSADGKRIYFTSDRSGANNIYSVDLESGEMLQYTNAVTGCFQPTVLPSPTGGERVVFAGFWNRRFDLYVLDPNKPITPPIRVEGAPHPPEPVEIGELPRFEPAIEVALDDANKDTYNGLQFFLEDLDAVVGVSDDQTVIGQTVVTFSDFLGDRRIIGAFQSIESFQDLNFYYVNLKHRVQWQAHLFDDRDFFLGFDARGDIRRRRSVFEQTGASFDIIYPIDFWRRVEFGVGFISRNLDFPTFEPASLSAFLGPFPADPEDPTTQRFLRGIFGDVYRSFVDFENDTILIPSFERRSDDYPFLRAAIIGDTVSYAPWGIVNGRRWRLGGDWAPDTSGSGTLTSSINVDFRQYVPVTKRTNFAFRTVGFANDGNAPDPVFFGGLDQVRGFDFRSIAGDHGFFTNIEFRFPVVGKFDNPTRRVQGVRGFAFLDVAGAWFSDFQSFDFYDEENNRLQDAVSSFGAGLTVRLFGLDFNWALAQRWDFNSTEGNLETSFWLGPRF